MSTAYHAKYFALDLTRKRAGSGADRISASLFDAAVDLNPHQIDAAVFALQSPVSSGVLLADEVGLGKTIETGLVLTQLWAERKRRLLVICPASLRKQWSLELEEKFNLPTVVVDAGEERRARADGIPNAFDRKKQVVITSLNFASARETDVLAVPWDVVVIDEAHKLRNAHRPSNRMGQKIRRATEGRRKILLTATPLQNSLMELYGLSTLIDERLFGDQRSFREQYMRADSDTQELRERLTMFSKRTLRRQVLEYVRYTERRAMLETFSPSDDEQRLYDAVSDFLTRAESYALPPQQRLLATLVIRKILASSSTALVGTLETMKGRLEKLRDGLPPEETLAEELVEGDGLEEDYLDAEFEEEPDEADDAGEPEIDRERLEREIEELATYAEWARAIAVDSKTKKLLTALTRGFDQLEQMGARRKAVVFTESRRTLEYLREYLEQNGFAGKVVTFSGVNSDPESRAIYQRWLEQNKESGRATGSRDVDMRTALIDHFRDSAEVMIATEAGAEGINLQFCSFVINYDLPWNPQRIEQRIGRCHRYGQKHDVVVLNFLNQRNEADRRVLELLTEKFRLFDGVFGASDEVLGTIESGVDFEKRILRIYQDCRTSEEIEQAFEALQAELAEQVSEQIVRTRETLMEQFDEDVHERLRIQLDGAQQHLDRVTRQFWELTKYELGERATYHANDLAFTLFEGVDTGEERIPAGLYHLVSKTQQNVPGAHLYRLSHPLGEWVLDRGANGATPPAEVTFDITHHATRIADVQNLKGHTGVLRLDRLRIESLDDEEHLVFTAIDDNGEVLDQERCEKLWRIAGEAVELPAPVSSSALDVESKRHIDAAIAASMEYNNAMFEQERERLEKWADDVLLGAERELESVKNQIKAAKRESRTAASTPEHLALQEKIRELEAQQRVLRREIFDKEDEIAEKRDELIANLQQRMQQKSTVETVFTIRWRVV